MHFSLKAKVIVDIGGECGETAGTINDYLEICCPFKITIVHNLFALFECLRIQKADAKAY